MSRFQKRGVAKGATGPPTMHLPQHIYQLFESKPIEPFKEWTRPKRGEDDDRRLAANPSTGVAGFVGQFEPFDRKNAPVVDHVKIVKAYDLKEQGVAAKRTLKRERVANRRAKVAEGREARRKAYDPLKADPAKPKTANAFTTLFVGNLAKAVDDEALRQHLQKFGKVASVVRPAKAPYAFVEFESDADFKNAYAQAQKKIAGKNVVIDIERARTVKDWKPKTLGGGVRPSRPVSGRGGRDYDRGRGGDDRNGDRYGSRYVSRSGDRDRGGYQSRDRDRGRDNWGSSRDSDRSRDRDRDRRR